MSVLRFKNYMRRSGIFVLQSKYSCILYLCILHCSASLISAQLFFPVCEPSGSKLYVQLHFFKTKHCKPEVLGLCMYVCVRVYVLVCVCAS